LVDIAVPYVALTLLIQYTRRSLQDAVHPPSTMIEEPVIIADASLARNTTAPMMSSKLAIRPRAILESTYCLNAGSFSIAFVISVSMKVGHIVFTRIAAGPSSSASALEKPSIACLVAQYTVRFGPPTCPI